MLCVIIIIIVYYA